ncbi:MAG: EAL domain-containing protein [Xanthobacteraceae bacterium]
MSATSPKAGGRSERNGVLRWLAALPRPIKVGLGRVLKYEGFINSLLQIERRLTVEKQQFAIAVNSISQGLCMFDRDERLVLCNRHYLEMYNLSAEVVKPGCSFREIIDHRKAVGMLDADPEQYCREILESKNRWQTISRVVVLGNGRHIHQISQPTSDGGWVATHEDVTERRTAAEQVREAHARLRDAIDILPQGIVFLDAEGRYILWNQQYAEIYKRSADLFKPGARLADTLRIGVERGDYPEAKGREEEWIAQRLALLSNPVGRHEQRLADGRCILIEERRTTDGGIIGLRVDITEMKQREASFRLLFDGNPVPMFVYALDDQSILGVNDAAVGHYGYQRAQFLQMTMRDIHDAQECAEWREAVAASSNGHAGRTWKHRIADGSSIDVAIFLRELPYAGRQAALIAAIDITERKRAEARVAFMAHHDALTSLPNRVLLRLRMQEVLRQTRRTGRSFAALFVDLDNFKSINDTLGHPLGDLLLQRVADRMRAELRDQDTMARLGGDEFAILQTEIEQPGEVSALIQRLLTVIGAPYELEGHQVTIGACIGVAVAPGDGDDPDRLLKNADLALHRAKVDGKGCFRFFEPEMDARVQARRQLEIDLRAALQTGALEVHYQPLVDLRSGEVRCLEALLRWPHPQRGMVPPAEFIPVAEETGLIGSLGAFVLRRACADAATWPKNVKVAVNLSPLQFKNGNPFVTVNDALASSGLAPARLELEITEATLLEKSESVLATLHALRALGVRISMDDFGTGYSSLSYLRSFPFDKIKIDRSFVNGVGDNADSQAIVRAIITLGTSLGITITAEGVESETDLAYMQAEGCNEGQGYLFSKARPSSEIQALLRSDKACRAA